MAINASNSGVVSRTGSYSIKDFPLSVSVTERSVSTANNTSTLDLSCTLKSNTTKTAWSGASDSYLALYWHDNVSNTNKKVGSNLVINTMGAGESKSISGSLTITHASDGTATGYAYATWTKLGSNSAVPGTGTVRAPASGNLSLTTIARTTPLTLNKSSYTVTTTGSGTAIMASYTPNSAFTYTLTASMDGNTTTLSSSSITNDILLSLLKTKANDTLTVTLTTKSGSTVVGTSSATCSIAIDIDKIKPSVTAGTPGIVSGGYSSKAVAGRSILYIDCTATSAGGSPTTTTTVTISNGGTMQNSSSTTVGTGVRYRTNTLPASSSNYTLTFYISAKDARGAVSTTVTKTIQVYGWYTPKIKSLYARRTTSSSSTATDVSGAYVRVDVTNDVSTNLGTSTTTTIAYTTSAGDSGSFTGTSCNFPLPIDKTAEITVTTVDPIGVSVTRTTSVAMAAIPLQLYMNNDGSSVGAGIGSVAKPDCFNIGLHTYLQKNLYIGSSKGDFNDGVAGVSIHTNGNLALTSDTYPLIEFYSQNSTTPTSYIKEQVSGTLKLSNHVIVTGGIYNNDKGQFSDGKTGVYLGVNGSIYSWAGTGEYPTLVFRRKDNTNIAYIQANEAENKLTLNATGGVNITNSLKRNGQEVAFSDTTNVIHFKWVSGTGLEVYVDQTKVATLSLNTPY